MSGVSYVLFGMWAAMPEPCEGPDGTASLMTMWSHDGSLAPVFAAVLNRSDDVESVIFFESEEYEREIARAFLALHEEVDPESWP